MISICHQLIEAERICSKVCSSQHEIFLASIIESREMKSRVDNLILAIQTTEETVESCSSTVITCLCDQKELNFRLRAAFDESQRQICQFKAGDTAHLPLSVARPESDERCHVNVSKENESEERNPTEDDSSASEKQHKNVGGLRPLVKTTEHGNISRSCKVTCDSRCQSPRLRQELQYQAKLVKSLSTDISHLQNEISCLFQTQHRALSMRGHAPDDLHIFIRRFESQALDLELALRAIRKGIRDFVGASLLFNLSQERKERKALLEQIEALKIEISSKDARIAAMHSENRSLVQKCEKIMKTEQLERKKIQDQLSVLISEREQMKTEYSTRISAMHEAVIKLTEDGDLLDASLSEEVRKRDLMIDEMKSYLLGEVQAMKETMMQLVIQNRNSPESEEVLFAPSPANKAGSLNASFEALQDSEPARGQLEPTKLLASAPPPQAAATRSSQPSAAASSMPYSHMLSELREVLDDTGGGLPRGAGSAGGSPASIVQRARSRRQSGGRPGPSSHDNDNMLRTFALS